MACKKGFYGTRTVVGQKTASFSKAGYANLAIMLQLWNTFLEEGSDLLLSPQMSMTPYI